MEDQFRLVLALLIDKLGMERARRFAGETKNLLPSESEVPALVKRADELWTAQSKHIAAADEVPDAPTPKEGAEKVSEPAQSTETRVSAQSKPLYNSLFGQPGGLPVVQNHGLGLGGSPIKLPVRPGSRDPKTIS